MNLTKYDLRNMRIQYVRENIYKPDVLVLEGLKSYRLISKKYTSRNLLVDRWFISGRGYKICELPIVGERSYDFNEYILLRVVIQALIDFSSGRPCDNGIWKTDAPPSGKLKCYNTEHICSENARVFLLKTVSKYEEICGIKYGTILYLMNNLKRKSADPCAHSQILSI